MERSTIKINVPGVDEYHIPGVHNMQVTLCGWIDVNSKEFDYKKFPCNCFACKDALEKIRELRFPKGYFSI